MGEAATTTLTVAKLKALCILNDLSASGKKSELLERLLEAGVDKETLGVEVFDDKTATFHSTLDEDSESVGDEEAVMFSLEDEDTLTPTRSDDEPEMEAADLSDDDSDDDILEAEILDADLVEIDEDESQSEEPLAEPAASPGVSSVRSDSPATLIEMLQKPQVAAVLLTVIILGAGGWYYINNQLEPFTADSLRYGDEMRYAVLDGSFMATEEFVELITDRIETEDDICKIRMMFEGSGEAKITDGQASELSNQGSLDRLGAVRAKGGQGMDWLAVESTNNMDFTGPGKFEIFRHVRSSIPGSDACSATSLGGDGNGMLTVTRWTELREDVNLATQLDFSA